MPSWTVVGLGRCGLQLARAMRAGGIHVAAAVARSQRARELGRRLLPGVDLLSPGEPLPAAATLLVAVPDDRIADVDTELARAGSGLPSVALHTSGLLPAAELRALATRGVHAGSFHPLVTFALPDGPLVPLDGVLAALEGHPAAVAAGRDLALALRMRPHRLAAAAKPRYHAAAALAGNLAHAVVRLAVEEMGAAGLPAASIRTALAPLVEAAVRNALESRGWERLTGPLSRGDTGTVTAHLRALDDVAGAAYRTLAEVAVARLEAAGNLDRTRANALRRALTDGAVCASVRPMRRHEGT